MAQQVIGQGPGNLVPDTELKKFLANGAIVKGDVVGLVGATGYTVDQCSATAVLAFGVAAESGTDVWINVVVSGFCDFVSNDGTDSIAGDLLIGVASGKASSMTVKVAETDAGHVGWVSQAFGQALAVETGTTFTTAMIFKRY